MLQVKHSRVGKNEGGVVSEVCAKVASIRSCMLYKCIGLYLSQTKIYVCT